MKLSETASGLILIALADLEKVEQDERFKINMNVWHSPVIESGKCMVCFAGAVMAMSLKIPNEQWVLKIKSIGSENARQMVAINYFRLGMIHPALNHFGAEHVPVQFPPYPVTPYQDNPQQFKTDMRHIANLLEKAGL